MENVGECLDAANKDSEKLLILSKALVECEWCSRKVKGSVPIRIPEVHLCEMVGWPSNQHWPGFILTATRCTFDITVLVIRRQSIIN